MGRGAFVSENSLHSAIHALQSTSAYHQCLLLVHPSIRRLEQATDEVHTRYGWLRLCIGLELSTALLTVPPPQRPWVARQWFETRMRELAPGPLLCSEIDLLFEPTLDLDPLWLLRHCSRTTALVVVWAGSYQDGVLAYAVPGHAHYRIWRQPSVTVTVLE
ncbi:MAG TPA: BREX-3 system P-loop-containing protein BrxF [Chloroflexi bacterium]|nr:BREX-3 system P-loop-containing protein BrxF [Chloroflexota bacterium]